MESQYQPGVLGYPVFSNLDGLVSPDLMGFDVVPTADKAHSVEVILSGHFPSPFTSTADELKAINANHWNPSNSDFLDVGSHHGQVTMTTGLKDFLNEIEAAGGLTEVETISRLNLISHGTDEVHWDDGTVEKTGFIALTGSITGLDENGEVTDKTGAVSLSDGNEWDDSSSGISVANLASLRQKEPALVTKLRKKFAAGAEIYLFSCLSGAQPELVQAIADTFQVPTRGSTRAVWYGPTKTSPIDRNRTAHGSKTHPPPANTFKPGFKHMDSGLNVRKQPNKP